MSSVRKAMLLRPLVAKLRLRRTLANIRARASGDHDEVMKWKDTLRPAVQSASTKSSIHEWSQSRFVMAQDPFTASTRTSEILSTHEEDEMNSSFAYGTASNHTKTYRVGSWLSYIYGLDINGLKGFFFPDQGRVSERDHKENVDLIILVALTSLVLVCVAIFQSSIGRVFWD